MDSLPADEANATREENLLGDASDVSGEDVIPALPHENASRAVDDGVEEDQSDSEDELPFEPFDIKNDGRIVKTASSCSRASWKHPESGWYVTITVHRFREFYPTAGMNDVQDETKDSDGSKAVMKEVEPNMQVELKLGHEDEEKGFKQNASNDAQAAGVELHPSLHDGIETMGRNERATFVITTDGRGGEDGLQPRCLEYDLSLDDWTEVVDLSEDQDGSLVKRIVREGDGTTQPVDVGKVLVRCRIVRIRPAGEPSTTENEGDNSAAPKGEEKAINVDNIQNQIDASTANASTTAQEEEGEEVILDNMQSQNDNAEGNNDGRELQGPTEFVLDDCPFGPGVMNLVKSMSRGEMCKAWLGRQYVPAPEPESGGCRYHVTLELVEVEELPPVWGSDETRLKLSARFKLEGNDKFAQGDYRRALRRYAKAIRYADGVGPGGGGNESDHDEEEDEDDKKSSSESQSEGQDKDTHDDHTSFEGEKKIAKKAPEDGIPKNDFLDMQVAILCNQAACHLKLGDGISALEAAERASGLKAPKDSVAGVKAAYRRACALEAIGEWDESRAVFQSVLEADPKNAQCRQGLARLARAEKGYRESLKTAFGGCLMSGKLDGFASDDRPASGKTGNSTHDSLPAGMADSEFGNGGPWSNDGSGSSTGEDGSTESGSSNGYDHDHEASTSGEEGEEEEDIGGRGGGVEEEKSSGNKESLKTEEPLSKDAPFGHAEALGIDEQPKSTRFGVGGEEQQTTSEITVAPSSEPPVDNSGQGRDLLFAKGTSAGDVDVCDGGYAKVPSPSQDMQDPDEQSQRSQKNFSHGSATETAWKSVDDDALLPQLAPVAKTS